MEWMLDRIEVNPVLSILGGAWQKDSVQFKMKAEEGVGSIRLQFEDGDGKVGKVFQPIDR